MFGVLSDAQIHKTVTRVFMPAFAEELTQQTWRSTFATVDMVDLVQTFRLQGELAGVKKYEGGDREAHTRAYWETNVTMESWYMAEAITRQVIEYQAKFDEWINTNGGNLFQAAAANAAAHPFLIFNQLRGNLKVQLGIDNVPFYYDLHPYWDINGKALYRSNLVTGTGVLFAAVQADFESAIQLIMGWVNMNGLPFFARREKLKLIIYHPDTLTTVFQDLFLVETLTGGAENRTAKIWKNQVELQPTSLLNGSNSWYIDIVHPTIKPFCFVKGHPMRMAVDLSSLPRNDQAAVYWYWDATIKAWNWMGSVMIEN